MYHLAKNLGRERISESYLIEYLYAHNGRTCELAFSAFLKSIFESEPCDLVCYEPLGTYRI